MRLFLNDVPSSIDDICKTLSLNAKDIPFHHKTRNFKRLGFENKRDVQTKKAIIPRGYGINNTIDLHLKDGNSAKITYAENVKAENVGGVSILNYTPLSTMLPGLELSVREDQKNLFFFLFIHPYNKQSPLNAGKPNPNLIYEFVDNEKSAREAEAKEDLMLEALLILKGMDEKSMRQVAKGYKMDRVDDLSDAEVKRMLRAKLTLDPSQFILNMEDNEIALEGVIQDAIDKGIISERTVGINKIWSLGDKELTITQVGSSPMMAIRAIIESNLELYFPLLQNGIEASEKASVLKTPANNRFFENFKTKREELDPLTGDDRRAYKDVNLEEIEIEKLRKWYSIDVNDTNINGNTRKAVIAKGDKILEQFAKDLAEGLIPEGTNPPVVKLLETA